MPPISTVEGSGFIPEIWLATALGYLRNYLTISRTVTMDSQLPTGESFSVGKTLHLPKRGTLNVNQKTETGTFTVQNPQSSTVDVSLNHHPEVTFAITSEMMAFQNQDQMAGYMADGIAKLAEDVDSNLMNVWMLAAAANVVDNHTATLTEANILSARKILRDNKIIPNEMAYGVVSTGQEAAVLQLPNTVRYDALGVSNNVSRATVGNGIPVMPGAIGRIYGFETCPSQLVAQAVNTSNAIQLITITGTPTGGGTILTANSLSTGVIPFNATAAQVQTALASILGAGLVFVTGGPGPGTAWTVAQPIASPFAITTTDSFTGGSSPASAVTQPAQNAGARNLFYTRDAILMASRALPLPEPGEGAIGTVMTDPESGITMRLVRSWSSSTGNRQMTLDLLYGFNLMRGEHLVVVKTTA